MRPTSVIRTSGAGRRRRYARRVGDEAAASLAFDVAAEHYGRARARTRLADKPVEQGLDLDLARRRALQ